MTDQWQSDQLSYPRDVDYDGAKSGIFDLGDDADNLLGKLDAGNTFIYLFRRFGYPRFGWDGRKHLVQYSLTTPMAGVLLTVEPAVTGGGTFGYMLRDDIDHASVEEDRKPYREWDRQCETWVLEEYGIELIRIFEQDDDKLQRVWKRWCITHEANNFKDHKEAEIAFYEDQAGIRIEYDDRYTKITPRPKPTLLKNRSAKSIIKQCHVALCAAIEDMLRPVYVRDVMIDIRGVIPWDTSLTRDRDAVDYAADAGCGVGDKLCDFSRKRNGR